MIVEAVEHPSRYRPAFHRLIQITLFARVGTPIKELGLFSLRIDEVPP